MGSRSRAQPSPPLPSLLSDRPRQVTSSYVKSSQVQSSQIESWQAKSNHVTSSQAASDKSTQSHVKSNQVTSLISDVSRQVISRQVTSSHAKSSHIKSSQVRTSQGTPLVSDGKGAWPIIDTRGQSKAGAYDEAWGRWLRPGLTPHAAFEVGSAFSAVTSVVGPVGKLKLSS